jgi:hypothetical protein
VTATEGWFPNRRFPQVGIRGSSSQWEISTATGNVDAAIDHVFGNSMGVLMGNGLGGLSAVQSYPTGENPYAIDTADIDGDGDLELVTSNFGTADWTIYENAGGVFVNPRTLSSDRSGSCAVLHDRDMDGDIDLTGFDEIHDWIYFYENVTNPSGVKPPTATAMLEQNHPNPFNPTTSIRFELSSEADVTLAVYDAAGAFSDTHCRWTLRGGTARGALEWNPTPGGARVASGVYFYRLFSGDIRCEKKMVLLK